MLTALVLAVGVVSAGPAKASECSESVSKLVTAADSDTRVVITFTGSQKALLPVDERLDPRFESTLFPISLDTFVLTLQIRHGQFASAAIPLFAQQLCSAAASSGARFNGVMSFKFERMTRGGRTLTRNRMTDAVMAEPVKK